VERHGRWVYWFSDPPPEGVAEPARLLGGKGASLKSMSLAGLAVPPGFTISTEACRRFFEFEGRWPEGLESEVRDNLTRLEAETGRRFGRGKQPLLLAVRSGAAVSMPGMMDTVLNCGLHLGLGDEMGGSPGFWRAFVEFIEAFARTVHGIAPETLRDPSLGEPSENVRFDRETAAAHLRRFEQQVGQPLPSEPWDQLVACIHAVFRSWNSERAAAYRRQQGITGLGGTAVNIQSMFPSEVSGILFTQDPTADTGRMLIESSYGLGEAIVSGQVNPDRFLVRRNDPTQITSQIGDRPHGTMPPVGDARRDPGELCLSPAQIAELCRLGLRLEQHFGYPVDVEWAWAEGQFALLQARAIRGLDAARLVETVRRAEIDRLKTLAGGARRVWVLHNLAETLPAPTPLTWDVMQRFMSGSGGFGRMYRELGYRPSSRVRRDGFLELIGGRPYADSDRLAEMFWESVPARYDLNSLLADKSLLDRGPLRFDPDKASGRFLLMLPVTLWSMCRSAIKLRRLRRDGERRFEQLVLPPYLDWVQQKRCQDLTKLSDEMLLAEFNQRRVRVLDEFGPESLKPGFAGGLAFQSLQSLLVQLGGPVEGAALANTLTSALDGDTTFEQNAMLYEVAAGRATLDAFLDRFGHRAHGEMELARPRWREELAHLEQSIDRLRAGPGRSPQEMHEANLARRQAAEAELPAKLAEWGGSSLRERIEHYVEQARRLLPYRESGKHYLMMGYELIRGAIEEFARRWQLGGDVYFLRLKELSFLCQRELPGSPQRLERLRDEIQVRRQRWLALQKLDLPDMIDSAQLDDLRHPRVPDTAAELAGTGVAPGSASGRACVALRPDLTGELPAEYILVCPSTDPGWTPLFLSARGLVMERGGVLSHGAIIARDFGIPAVICPGATRAIVSGDRIRVDGSRGSVHILEKAGR